MIEYTKGDILESDCEALINTVNCHGRMGKGLALLFKKKFPKMFLAYKKACDRGQVKVGNMHVWKNPTPPPSYIINFPTKDHWRNPSKMEWIVAGLQDLIAVIESTGISSVAVPPLGCGLGGLQWYLVRQEIKKSLGDLDKRIVVYEP